MNIAIDIGNSRTKVAVYENNTILETVVFSQQDFRKKITEIFKKNTEQPQIVLSNVGKLAEEDLLWLQKNGRLTVINHQSPTPFENLYTTPQTLGIDRLVLASGATLKYPQQNRLVIDAGTCITYDFISAEDQYLGGAIAPGFSLKYKSLNDYTAKLPLLHLEETHTLTGKSTHESIQSGIINGTIYEIDTFIDQYKLNYSNLTVILTGGDAVFLAKRLKNTIFAHSNFLLESLITHHQYIIDNDKENHIRF